MTLSGQLNASKIGPQMSQNLTGQLVFTPGVLHFAVVRGRADFQGRRFVPKIFWTGCKFGFQLSAGPKNILDRVENWVLAMSYSVKILLNRVIFSSFRPSKFSLNIA